jgi:hypothetical protein
MPTRSENTEYAKALAQKRRVKAAVDKDVNTDDRYEIEASDRTRAQRELPKANKKLARVSKETGYDYSEDIGGESPTGVPNVRTMVDRLSRSGNQYSSGMSEGEYAAADDTEPNPRPVSQYRKGGAVKKKSGGMMKKNYGGMVKMKSGGAVRGGGIAQRGQGKMRMC